MTDAGLASEAAAAPTAPAGARCEKDEDCGWEDPCAPKACGAKVDVDAKKKCGRPTTPGACRCAGNVCSLIRPEKVRTAERTACQAHADCAFDPTAGTCVAGPPSSTSASGIQCLCDTLNKWCVQMWQGDVPCKSARDCSWRHLNGDGTKAAPAWYSPRQKPVPVRPCKDGEHDSVCVDGHCEIRAWKC